MKLYIFFLTCLSIALLAGCSRNDITSPNLDNPVTLQKTITSPSDIVFDHVNLSIDSVQVHMASSGDNGGWVTINSTPAIFDILLLSNVTFPITGQTTVPAGKYNFARVYIGTGSNVVVNGEAKPLMIPSGSQSGVKIKIDATIEPLVNYIVSFTFDPNNSINITGSPSNPNYILNPNIRTLLITPAP